MARRISHISNLLEPAPGSMQRPPSTATRSSWSTRRWPQHPDVIILALHATPPGNPADVIVGANIGRIGKKADED